MLTHMINTHEATRQVSWFAERWCGGMEKLLDHEQGINNETWDRTSSDVNDAVAIRLCDGLWERALPFVRAIFQVNDGREDEP